MKVVSKVVINPMIAKKLTTTNQKMDSWDDIRKRSINLPNCSKPTENRLLLFWKLKKSKSLSDHINGIEYYEWEQNSLLYNSDTGIKPYTGEEVLGKEIIV